jgi:tetratricopeptide (TPR) repeat protein
MRRLGTAHLCAGLLALTVAAYLPLWNNGFVNFDDRLYITENPAVTKGLSWSGLRWAWTNFHVGYWQPVSWMSLQFDAHFFSSHTPDARTILSARAFHLDNLFWHCGSVVLLFTWLQRLTAARWRSFLVAALFALHPMRVESVAWAAERKDVLCVFFGLLTLWAYTRYAAEPGWRRYVVVAGVYALSLLCKPMLMTLPFALLLLDYWPLHRPSFGRRVLEKLPLVALGAASGVVTAFTRNQTQTAVTLEMLPLSARLANAATAYGWYLVHTAWPRSLGVLYPHPESEWDLSAIIAGAGALLGLTALAAWQLRRRPWLLVGWLWFVVALLPVIGLAQGGSQAWADRFTYWPHIGLFVAVVWGLGELAERSRIAAGTLGTAGALVLGCFGVLTWLQVGYWKDSQTLWEHTLAVTESNHSAHANMGILSMEEGRLERAESHFAEAVRLRPRSAEYHYSLGVVLLSLGRDDDAAGQLRTAVQLEPAFGDAWHNLGMAHLRQERPAAAAACFRKALELQPEAADARAGLGRALWADGKRSEAIEAFRFALNYDANEADSWHGLGVACLTRGDLSGAVAALTTAARLRPNSVSVASDLAVALDRDGQWTEAASRLFEAVRMQEERERLVASQNGRAPAPEAAVTLHCRLAYALDHCGNHAAAAEAYRTALQRDPHWPEKFAAKAWRLATDPDPDVRDPEQAYELASQAVQAVADPPAHLIDTLAAAQAAVGKFQEAVLTARQALDKASAREETSLADTIRDHLRQYQEAKAAVSTGP